MKQSIKTKNGTPARTGTTSQAWPSLLVLFALGSLALSPMAQAVVPAPDGAYPGFNTAEGQNALKNLSTGQANTAVGWFSLFSDTTASFNTGVGAGTLALNTGDNNTATGAVALFLNTTGFENTAVGTAALLNNTEGESNTATGAFALQSNTTGFSNTATGVSALFYNTTGTNNIALGIIAGINVTTANKVIAIGSPGANVSDSCYIGNIFGATIDPGSAVAVGIDATGKLGTTASSRRFKEEIQPMDKASEALLS